MKQTYFENPELQDLLTPVLHWVENRQKTLTTVRPPSEENQDYEDIIHAIGKNRGRPLFHPYLGTGLGNGSFVELKDGSVKLDLVGGIGVHILGHSHPKVIKATLEGGLSDIIHQGHLQMNEDLHLFQTKILEIANRKAQFSGCWVTTSGSMANENALKICRQKTKARTIVSMKNAFAGRTTTLLEVTDNPLFSPGLTSIGEALRLDFFDPKNPQSSKSALRKFQDILSGHKVCCLMLEPIQGEGGFTTAPPSFFKPLLELCRLEKIPVWFDEIQTFARTGEFFAFETLGLQDDVDICTVSKSLQNGVTLWSPHLQPEGGILGGTFAGTSASLRAGRVILEVLDEEGFMGPQGKIIKVHKALKEALLDLKNNSCKGLISEVVGAGLMMAITAFDGSSEKRNTLVKKLFENGLLTLGCGRDVARVRFLPPATTTLDDISLAKNIIEKSLKELS